MHTPEPTAAAGQPAPTHPALRATLRMLTLLVLLLLTIWLSACGGGGDPATEVDTPQVNCALQPVLCK